MRKDIYSLINEIEHHADSYEIAPVSKEELQKWKQDFSQRMSQSKRAEKKRHSWKRYVAAAAVLLLLFGAFCPSIRQSVYAKSQEILYSLARLLHIQGDISPYHTIVGKSFTKDGITITLNDVIWDDDTLLASYTAILGKDADPALNEDTFSLSPVLYLNGRRISRSSGGAIYHNMKDPYFVNNYEFDIPSAVTLSGKQTMELVFYLDNPDNSFSGPPTQLGSLKFTTSADSLRDDTKQIALNASAFLPDGTQITFQEYTCNPISQKVKYITNDNTLGWHIILKGEDNMGNPVNLYTTDYLFDPDTGIGTATMVNDSLNDTYAIATEADFLTLTPYAVKDSEMESDENWEEHYQTIGEAFTISLR